MQLGLTYDLQTDPTDPRQAEFDPPGTIDALSRAFAHWGHQVVRLGGAHELLASPERLREVELVFNIAEGADGICREAWVPNLLDLWGIPYVGSDSLALSLGLDKALTKRLAASEGIRTPAWEVMNEPNDLPKAYRLEFPVIVKPRYEGSGMGIDAEAVVRCAEDLAQRVGALFARFHQPILVEEFIPFGELTVHIVGNLTPKAYPAIQRSLDPHTRLACHLIKPAPAQVVHPVQLDDACDARAREIALTMFETLGCRDLARVDLRVDEAGRLYFLEINPLPSFDPAGSLGLLAESLDTTYAHLVGEILAVAIQRLDIHAGRRGLRRRQPTESKPAASHV